MHDEMSHLTKYETCFQFNHEILLFIIPDIFKNTTGDVARFYCLEITPAGWAFSIWGVIYIWQAVWLVYGISHTCRSTSESYIYVSPAPIPPLVYLLFMINNILNMA